jgi:hypothetical protein
MAYTYISVLGALDWQQGVWHHLSQKEEAAMYPSGNGFRNTLVLQTVLELTGDWLKKYLLMKPCFR